MSQVIRVGGIAGSLRKGSYNKSALQAARKFVPKGSSMDIIDLEGIPGFNQDLEQAFRLLRGSSNRRSRQQTLSSS